MSGGGLHAWIDASAGVAGDMLLGALIDAGADLDVVRGVVDAVIPQAVELTSSTVTRAGLRATKVDVRVLVDDPPHRTWRTISEMLAAAEIPDPVRERATAVFARLADAEGHVHGIPSGDVHFHEVGALDSIADVVGVCAALHDLAVTAVTAGEVAVGSGRARVAHGDVPIPVPAVAELAVGWRVRDGGPGELATPTGMALVVTLATKNAELPSFSVSAVGVGAGTKDSPGLPNVVRVVLGHPVDAPTDDGETVLVLQANVDDMDPRLWPGVLTALMSAGALDAWLEPILMKKGRPAHTLSVLCRPDQARSLRGTMFATTSTIGIRQREERRFALPRECVEVPVDGGRVAVKVSYQDGVIVQVTPEFDDVAAVADRSGLPQADVLQQAIVAAALAGLAAGQPFPPDGGLLNQPG